MQTSRRLIISMLLVLAFSAGSVQAAGKFLADTHLAAGLTCESCHGQEAPGSVAMETCLSCHGPYDKLAKATADKKLNPHNGHFPDLDCGACHHGHKTDDFFCGTCH